MRILVGLLLATAAAVSCGCSVMESSALLAPPGERLDVGARDDGSIGEARSNVDDVSCRGKLGAYFLTKRLVRIKLEKAGSVYTLSSGRDPATSNMDLTKSTDAASGLVTVPDRQRGYCLEFLESQTSEDTIEVSRRPEGFLTKISSDTQDKSREIADTVIRTIFTVITGRPFEDDLRPTGERGAEREVHTPETLIEAVYDPADPVEAALINERLRQSGFCLILEGQPPVVVDDRKRYCDDPMGYVQDRASRARPGATHKKPLVQEHERMAPGIYYRPRRPYAYSVLINPRVTCDARDRKCREENPNKWTLREEKTIELENLSPIIAIRVDRTFFATRKTTIVFDDGVLYDVKIRKDSELAGFVQVPLQIAKSIVAVPGNLVKVRFDNTQSRTRLVAAQMLLMDQQRQHIDTLYKAIPPVPEGK